jgi:serine/threonine-protein kinase
MSLDPLLGRLQSVLEGQYRIERPLGRGGMATVYLARDVRHDRPVAIKLLEPEMTTPRTAERFLREINITAKLQHPHILTLIDSGARDGLVYYVMPHVEGESLRERLQWERQCEVGIAAAIGRQVATALAYAHDQGVIHRDVKPENILLSAGQAMLADFGIARAIWDSGRQVITVAGETLGTPGYLSPEQAMGSPDVDARADLYSLGCVLFEMLAGRPPFEAETIGRVIQKHLAEPAPRVVTFRAAVPAALDEIVATALAKDPADRFQRAAEMVDALALVEAAAALGRAAATSSPRRSS